MKQFVLITICLFGIFDQNAAQPIVSGHVIDKDKEAAIPYVNIGIVELGKGTVSDLQGKYTLQAKSEDNVITFSSIGYETVLWKAKDLLKMDTIHLSAKDYKLEGIEIAAQRFEDEEKIFGAKNDKRGKSIGFGSTQLGTEIGTVIEIKKPTFLKSTNFVLNHAKGDSLIFRVNIYDYSSGQLGNNLLKENVFIKEKQKKGTITLDFEEHNIILQSNILLTLEWIRNFDQTGNKDITFDTKKSRHMRGIYVRYSSNGKISKLPYDTKLKPCFYITGKQSK